MAYIRRYYGVPARRGGRVAWDTSKGTREGTITSATNYVYVRFDDATRAVPLHPLEQGLRYLPAGISDRRDAVYIDAIKGWTSPPATVHVECWDVDGEENWRLE